ncbi:MAG: hypothetical protein PHS92_00420 [Candidatus Gracilibacteria bacterium]|nr:hypothetical protein [Candidatus Gracilibacteria bacterium]
MITTIDLNYSNNIFPLLSENIIEAVKNNISEGKKVLLFLNRRGEAHSIVCKNCSYQVKCDFCDIGMTIHKYPKPLLICHHCNAEKNIPMECPKCSSTNLINIGTGVQKIEENLKKTFNDTIITRLDSDKIHKEGILIDEIRNSQIIIATESINTISIDNLGLVCFLLLELEFLIPEYNIEEQVYDNITYNMKRGSEIMIQTYIPDSNFIKLIQEGNFKDFVTQSMNERKEFNYPPYKELVYIWVRSKSKEKMKDMIIKLYNKLEINNISSNTIFYDKELFMKRNNEFHQKIVVKGDNLKEFLSCVKYEVFRNKEINLEWK